MATQGRLEAAIAEFRTALRLRPDRWRKQTID
jgi:Flp pilus assembly protein TadD